MLPNLMKRLLTLTTFSLLLISAVKADVFDEMLVAVRNGNAKEVARFFNASVELTILNDEGVYSRQQAEVVLRNFFSQHLPKSVVLQHKGASAQGARYAIAVYECAQGKYRMYIFMKDQGTGMQVHELRIEKD